MMKKKVFLSSILTIAICLCLIAGSTFALFTSESKVNVAVQAATVDVVATAENFQLSSTLGSNVPETVIDYAPNTNTVKVVNMVPGDVISFDLRIHNNSNVTVDFRTILSVVEDTGLWNGLTVTFNTIEHTVDGNGTAVLSDYQPMAAYAQDIIVNVIITLPASAGNEYQNTTCTFAYTVEAVQGNAQ